MHNRREGVGYRNPTWGDQNLFRGGGSLNCLCEHPTTRPREGTKGVQYLKQGRPDMEADIRSSRPARDVRARADGPELRGDRHQGLHIPGGCFGYACQQRQATDNDPSAGSPTETLLRLLLPLNATVWSSSRQADRVIRLPVNPRTSLKHSIGSSDGRCVQRAGT